MPQRINGFLHFGIKNAADQGEEMEYEGKILVSAQRLRWSLSYF